MTRTIAVVALAIAMAPTAVFSEGAPLEYKGKICEFTDINTLEHRKVSCDELFEGIDKARSRTSPEKFSDWCKYEDNDFFIKDYPVSGKRSVIVFLKTRDTCGESQLRLFCLGGACQAFPSSGDYGYHPTGLNKVAINKKRWSWRGEHPDWIGHEMWKAVKDGAKFSYELSHWVDSYPSGSEKVYIPSDLKNKIYKMSLGKP